MNIYALLVLLVPVLISAAEKAPEKPNKDIFQAIARNEPGVVRFLLSEKPALMQTYNTNGDTPLLAAVRTGNEELVRLLISYDPHWLSNKDINGNTALHTAVETGNSVLVKLFLGLKPNLSSANNNGRTPLIIAAHKGNIASATLLLQAGADRAAVDTQGKNALLIAVDNGNVEMVGLLLSVRANDEQDITVLEHAANLLLRMLAHSDYYKQKYEKNKNAQDNATSLEYLQEAQRYQRLLKEFFRQGANRNAEYKKRMKQILNAYRKLQDKALWNGRETYAKSLDSIIQSLKH
jgi:ankyrin repeat protein